MTTIPSVPAGPEPGTRIEWGTRWSDGTCVAVPDEADARAAAESGNPAIVGVVRRSVAVGPWMPPDGFDQTGPPAGPRERVIGDPDSPAGAISIASDGHVEAAILRWAADRLDAYDGDYDEGCGLTTAVRELRAWADEFDQTGPPAGPGSPPAAQRPSVPGAEPGHPHGRSEGVKAPSDLERLAYGSPNYPPSAAPNLKRGWLDGYGTGRAEAEMEAREQRETNRVYGLPAAEPSPEVRAWLATAPTGPPTGTAPDDLPEVQRRLAQAGGDQAPVNYDAVDRCADEAYRVWRGRPNRDAYTPNLARDAARRAAHLMDTRYRPELDQARRQAADNGRLVVDLTVDRDRLRAELKRAREEAECVLLDLNATRRAVNRWE